jgi:Rrf2 family nitric oxide-sensitive transcriptional repressor
MRLTKHTDFGLQILMYLALKPDEIHTIADLSERFDLSRNHLMKISNKVVNLGYVTSFRGRAGGLQLAKPANRIRIGEVIEHLEQTLVAVDCNDCRYRSACKLKAALNSAMKDFITTMNTYTLADITSNEAKLLKLVG